MRIFSLNRLPRLIVVIAIPLWIVGTAAWGDEFVVLPGNFTLTGAGARQTLLVERRSGDDSTGEIAEGVAWSSSDEKVVAVKDGSAVAVVNGKATLTAKVGSQTASSEVTVVAADKPTPINFRNQVQAVLAKAGCNSGACHGAAAGKNGFKLSLRGYDSDADFFAITRQARGRRIVPDDPGRSLLLLKPTGALPHKGGVRLEVDSPDYNVIAGWLAAGAPGPQESDPRLERLEFFPAKALLKPGDQQRLIVRAVYTDGHAADVTHWVKFTSSDESVAQVDQEGRVKVMGPGEGVISGWFASRIAVAPVTVPFPFSGESKSVATEPAANFIDALVAEKLRRLNIEPSPPAGDSEFLRRAYLDTIGVLPTLEETKAFLGDKSPDKRNRLIDALLERPEFVDYWSSKWSDLLLVNSEKLKPPAMWAYYRWIRAQVAENAPWDRVARSVATATGSTLDNGAANFYVLHQDPMELAETTSQAFLGMSIGCAHCHNHPLEKWTNDQYYGMANLFARVRVKNGDGDGAFTVYSTSEGELIQPRTGKPQPPRPLDAEAISFDSPVDRRAALADWLTSPDNPYFSRAITNRVWANFLGVGLVEAVDDVRLTNPPSNPELLSALARYLVEHHYGLKSLMRLILQSRTFQRSSDTRPGNAADRRFYSRYFAKRLKAETLLDAISQVSGAPSDFPGYAKGWRAMQLPDANVNSYFLKAFGRPQRLLTCECERTNAPSMVQVLHISNGDTLNQKLAQKDNRIDQLLADKAPDEQIVNEVYLSSLCRPPTEAETQALMSTLSPTPAAERRQAIEDLYWSVLSSKEFLFNH